MASSGTLFHVGAAIDFGTTYSGYAFSFRHDFEADPLKVSTSIWIAGPRTQVYNKTPTAVLFDNNKKFHSFGYEAEDDYSELVEDDIHTDWYYFRGFKMMRNEEEGEGGLTRNILLKDIRDRELPALKVFSETIKYLKGHLLKALQKRATDVKDTDIVWVLTVPAIWNDSAKQVMLEAAEEAGIKGDQLTIAPEPEFTALYCKNLPVEKLGGSEQGFTCFSKGSKYLELDAGTTVDIAVHEVQQDGSIKELYKTSGRPWGGANVDESFRRMLVKIVGNDVMEAFCRESTSDFIDMFREFETKKRTVDHTTKNKITMKIPIALKELFEALTEDNLNETIEQTIYNGKLVWIGDRLRIQPETFRQLFSDATESIIKHLLGVLAQKSCERTSTIIMVGGFSESPLLQARVTEAFSKMTIFIPPNPELTVLKGAVIFGHTQKPIKARLSEGKTNPIPLPQSLSRSILQDQGMAHIPMTEYQQMVRRMESQQVDIDEMTTRLTSNQVTEGNPNIPTLSDKNRPTKIGEKFVWLFEDEWSDAFDAFKILLKIIKKDDEPQSISQLLRVMNSVQTFCVEVANDQLEQLKRIANLKQPIQMVSFLSRWVKQREAQTDVEGRGFDSATEKYARNFRKECALQCVTAVVQMYKGTQIKKQFKWARSKYPDAIHKYVDRCVELIWLMSVQDPPMFLSSADPGDKVMTDMFTCYSQRGTIVSATVWPAVPLHVDGPIISKGYILPQ